MLYIDTLADLIGDMDQCYPSIYCLSCHDFLCEVVTYSNNIEIEHLVLVLQDTKSLQ